MSAGYPWGAYWLSAIYFKMCQERERLVDYRGVNS